ncbi:MAG: hypothetical protein ACE5JX_17835 [Acidobacteriota bacterium]
MSTNATSVDAPGAVKGGLRRVLFHFCIGMGLFLGLEFSIFHTGLYTFVMEPDSYAGRFELLRAAERGRRLVSGRYALLLGDSRMAEGFWEELAEEFSAPRGFHFLNASLNGSNPRVWYYLLREIDPEASRYQAILVPVYSYNDVGRGDQADRLIDLRTLNTRLTVADIPEFVSSYRKGSYRILVLRSILLKGSAFKQDLQDLLSHPLQRLDRRRLYQRSWRRWRYAYRGRQDSLQGLQYIRETGSLRFPPGLPERTRQRLEADLKRSSTLPSIPLRQYKNRWFSALVRRYKRSPTRIIFFRLPRRPIPPPEMDLDSGGAIPQLAEEGKVTLLDPKTFSFLERPRYFFDGLHLNGEGRRAFTQALVQSVLPVLRSERQATSSDRKPRRH